MDENDQCGLLKSFGLIRNLTELSLCVRRWSDGQILALGHTVLHVYTTMVRF